MSTPISVQPDELLSLGACLSALGGQLDEEAICCRATGSALRAGLVADPIGDSLGAVPLAWAGLLELLAEQCRSLGTTFVRVVQSYADVDGGLAAGIAAAGAAASATGGAAEGERASTRPAVRRPR